MQGVVKDKLSQKDIKGESGDKTRSSLLAVLSLIAIFLIIALRVVALRSDPFTRLDWSAGQVTDEGFYMHNARNVALFAHARTDDFNNMLLSPVLHFLQVGVFKMVGSGSVQARMISVVFSLLSLWIFWQAMLQAFGKRIALTALIFLGLDHTNLLFNRMALMDTPAMLPAVAAFYFWVRFAHRDQEMRSNGWLIALGIMLGLTVVSRTLCIYLLPVPFVALWIHLDYGKRQERFRAMLSVAAGIAVVFGIYGALWYLPHHAEISRMAAYYSREQMQPRSLFKLVSNMSQAVFGDHRGMAPYLFRHTPILFGLIILALVRACMDFRRWRFSASENAGAGSQSSVTECYLSLWFVLGYAMLAVISYSPARYYVTTYPALCAIAAITLWRIPEIFSRLSHGDRKARIVRAVLMAYLCYHTMDAIIHYGGTLPFYLSVIIICFTPLIAGTIAYRIRWIAIKKSLIITLLGLWAIVNFGWLARWGLNLQYTQYDMSRWLANNLTQNSVLIGDLAPGLSLDNAFEVMHVQKGLCNDVQPVERYAGRPRYILILDGRWKEEWWIKHYPRLVSPRKRIKLVRVLKWDVGVYSVPPPVRRNR